MQSFAFGEMGLPQSEFWEMTPREFSNACDGYNEKIERQFQTGWEQARWVATVVVNVNSPKKSYSPEDLVKFPWEGGATNQEDEIAKLKKWREARH